MSLCKLCAAIFLSHKYVKCSYAIALRIKRVYETRLIYNSSKNLFLNCNGINYFQNNRFQNSLAISTSELLLSVSRQLTLPALDSATKWIDMKNKSNLNWIELIDIHLCVCHTNWFYACLANWKLIQLTATVIWALIYSFMVFAYALLLYLFCSMIYFKVLYV